MMNKSDIKKLLSEIEADNAAELRRAKKAHIFSAEHRKNISEAFYGKNEPMSFSMCRRRIPLPLAVLIILLSVLMIVGCGLLIYQTFKFVPNLGIVPGENVVIYGTDAPISLKKVDVTNVSYVENDGRGELYIQLNSKYYSYIGNFSVFADGAPVDFEVKEEWGRNNLRFYTLAASVALKSYDITLSYKGYFEDEYSASVTLKNMSDESYKLLSAWPVIDGIELKMLPADSVNKIFELDVDLPENTGFAITDFNIYNDKGEVKGGFNPEGSSFYVCKGELFGSVTKIEINEVKISKYLGEAGDITVPVPKDGAALGVDIPLVTLDGYRDALTEVRREGDFVYLTRKITRAENTLVTACDVTVRMPDDDIAHMSEKYVRDGGTEIVYKIWVREGTETFIFRVQEYTYTLSGKEPLGVIRIEK
ncbi:MAG: hypothetical protein IJX55_03255 [Clostridia bacterium]|nr:hypothetical protein [Clostridia bacterium]MBQ8861824.1 hypothetical protein [Clostridia bacterium]